MPTTTTTTASALSRRALLSRTMAGAAGAAPGATAAMPAAKASLSADAELFAFLDEEERIWTMVSRLQDEAQRRSAAIPTGQIEIGRTITNGEIKPIHVTTEDKLAEWFDPPEISPEGLQFR